MIFLPPTITPRTRRELSSFVLATIEADGVTVPESSRLKQMHDLYNSGRGTIEPNEADYEIALEGERDLQLLAYAFDQLGQFQKCDTYRSLLKKLVNDSVLPQNDRENSSGRDAAFEIYAAAVCMAAGLLPIGFEEPDVTCTLDGIKYALAAKRVKNLNKLRKRIKKAGQQIDRSGLAGIIVLDLGPAFNPKNHRIRNMPDTRFWSEYEANFYVTWDKYQAKVQETIGCHRVLGIIVHDYHVRQQDQDWQLAGVTFRIPALARTSEEQRLFNRMSTLYVYGLPNQSDGATRAVIPPEFR